MYVYTITYLSYVHFTEKRKKTFFTQRFLGSNCFLKSNVDFKNFPSGPLNLPPFLYL